MKKFAAIFAVIALLAIVSSACAHKTCPAYRGSIAENTTINE